MLITSAEANKLLEKLRTDLETLRVQEQNNMTFRAAVSEDPESLRPNYDFGLMQEKIDKLNRRIMEVKHQLNLFNTRTVVVDGLTIDQVLVRMPQLHAEKRKLQSMMNRKEKDGVGITGNVIDYAYTNYIPKEAKKMFNEISDEITRMQIALDTVNTTEKFEVAD